jgi:ABC-type branched-subunit amino acid transport system ATPase component
MSILRDDDADWSCPVLEVTELEAGYSGNAVVRGINLSVRASEIATIVGPNGSGKSTLLKAIVKVIPLLGGVVRLMGEDLARIETESLVARGLGYVPQINDVFNPLTVEENLAVGGYSLPRKEVAQNMLRVMDIFPPLAAMRSRIAGRLSGGERKMLALARVMMTKPKVLVLDEPTANLAPALAKMLLTDYIPRLAQDGVAVLLVEQRAKDALEISDWGHVMVSGEVRVAATGRELLARDDIGELFLGKAVASSVHSVKGSETDLGRGLPL